MLNTAASRPFNLSRFRQQFRQCRLSRNDLVCAIGRYFLGVPYQKATLDSASGEKLVVNMQRLDCFTFVETVLALTLCVYRQKISRIDLHRQLQCIRYRKGIIDGYSSRLHYFTEWLRDNEHKKIIVDVSRQLGGLPRRKKINYMTSHRAAYRGLQDENEFKKMQLVEKSISRKVFHFIGATEANWQKEKIRNGDIIAFAADQEGLDIAHVGFALRQEGKLRLLHASSKEGAVVISEKTLFAYLQTNKKFTSIAVARLL